MYIHGLRWLDGLPIRVVIGDVRDRELVASLLKDADAVERIAEQAFSTGRISI